MARSAVAAFRTPADSSRTPQTEPSGDNLVYLRKGVDGILVTDLSFRLVAADEGASVIVKRSNDLRSELNLPPYLASELLQTIKSGVGGEIPEARSEFQVGAFTYSCRVSVLQPVGNSSAQPLLALHVQRRSDVGEALRQIAAKYDLTNREQEALGSLSIGLTYKDIAKQMRVSPNTVRNFLRRAMQKMGVSRRAGIISKVLDYRQNGD
jgi:DNA-binding CsgD family transcriptional regulator